MRADRRRKRSAGLWRGRFRNENQAALPTADTDAAPEKAEVFRKKEKLTDAFAEPEKEAHSRTFAQRFAKEETRVRERESHARRAGVADAAIEKQEFSFALSFAVAKAETQVLSHSRAKRDTDSVAIPKSDTARIASPGGNSEPLAKKIAAAGRDRFA